MYFNIYFYKDMKIYVNYVVPQLTEFENIIMSNEGRIWEEYGKNMRRVWEEQNTERKRLSIFIFQNDSFSRIFYIFCLFRLLGFPARQLLMAMK